MDSSNAVQAIDIFPLIMGLLGGLSIFLFGINLMTSALKKLAAGKLKDLFSKVTASRFKAAFMGMFVTAVIQSSTVTTVLVVGFVTAGLLSMPQSIGIIMGANIGSTITAQIIAFQVTQYALLLVAAGFFLSSFGRSDKERKYGIMILGLGLLFVGMEIMSDATRPLRTYPPFLNTLSGMDNPLLAILAGAVFTGIVHSSAVTTGVVIMFAGQGLITLEMGIALAFGANIGTCLTALLASIGKQREAVQAAVIHVLFNVFGVLIWYGFIDQLAIFVRWISPASPELEGMARLAAETPRQIANAHTAFNVANTAIFIWFAAPFAWLVRRLVPLRPGEMDKDIKPKYLDEALLETPDLALDRIRMEIARLGGFALELVEAVPRVIFQGSEEDIENLPEKERNINTLHGYIVKYIGRLTRIYLLKGQSDRLRGYLEIANDIENVGQIIESNLGKVGRERLDLGVHISEASLGIFRIFHRKISATLDQGGVSGE